MSSSSCPEDDDPIVIVDVVLRIEFRSCDDEVSFIIEWRPKLFRVVGFDLVLRGGPFDAGLLLLLRRCCDIESVAFNTEDFDGDDLDDDDDDFAIASTILERCC